MKLCVSLAARFMSSRDRLGCEAKIKKLLLVVNFLGYHGSCLFVGFTVSCHYVSFIANKIKFLI